MKKYSNELYSVIYADPPWNYNNPMKNYYGAIDIYPTMKVKEICDLPVQNITEKDAVLFMWATNPKLVEALQVIKSWGFEYKTNWCWDKVNATGGMLGFWSYGVHELLLISTKGKFSPPNKNEHKLSKSLIKIKKKHHSEKPEYFRTEIDRLFPTGKRIELFARSTAPLYLFGNNLHWDIWGNEVKSNIKLMEYKGDREE